MNDALGLFQQYKDPVYRLALSMTGSAADAEDVCQTVFLKVLEKQPDLLPGKERAWLFQVTANECRSLWRRLKRRGTVPLDQAAELAAPEEGALLRQVMELSPKDRTVLYLHYFEGFSTQETGALLHISQSAVTTRLLRARQRLKEQMGEDCLYEA
ncbi:MAG: sigma-70 family RNA polymerase sigma factor [Oscillospiraceae bacterium]|jgi:RNA polymerase sigma factor (sigma-70 family)|nr:sigma-70 family RNA polymerase sigma factor [Oscillospiraceae bacterium]MCI9394116.1 sigma-70 family RNA polymerase sigma factor [Oscillospiraceae bacterium]MCI9580972.1 sigma-70 family RNA polymerase sigma factor [Oscillospiraceae bacterium]